MKIIESRVMSGHRGWAANVVLLINWFRSFGTFSNRRLDMNLRRFVRRVGGVGMRRLGRFGVIGRCA